MPGATYRLRCPSCETNHVLRTGNGLGWAFEHFVCHRCRVLHSIPFEEAVVPGPCPACGLQLEPWDGRAWREPGTTFERVEGACPACLGVLSHEDVQTTEPW